MTKLSAVDLILRSAGRHGAAALQTGTSTAEGHAEEALDRELLKASTDYWHFNTEIKEITAVSSEFNVPAGTISIDTADTSAHRNVVQRGDRLYDLDNDTFTFTETTLTVQLVTLYEFDCIPEPVAQYIAICAARRFVEEREDPRSPRLIPIDREIRERRQQAHEWNQDSSDRSILDAPGARRITDLPHQNARYGLGRYGL